MKPFPTAFILLSILTSSSPVHSAETPSCMPLKKLKEIFAKSPGRPVFTPYTVKNGTYEVHWELGNGTEGTAYIATTKTGTRVTLKRFSRKKSLLSLDELQNWTKEYNAIMDFLNQHGHLNSVKIKEIFIENGGIYIVKPFTPGYDIKYLYRAIPDEALEQKTTKLLHTKMRLAFDLVDSPSFKKLVREFKTIHELDVVDENYVWFNDKWFLIDAIRLPYRLGH